MSAELRREVEVAEPAFELGPVAPCNPSRVERLVELLVHLNLRRPLSWSDQPLTHESWVEHIMLASRLLPFLLGWLSLQICDGRRSFVPSGYGSIVLFTDGYTIHPRVISGPSSNVQGDP